MLIHSAKELAVVVKDNRKQRKLSQDAVGKLVGIKQNTVYEFENKPGSTKLDTLFQILAAVNLEMRIVPKDQNVKLRSKWEHEW